MNVLEIGHPMWSRADADRVALALIDQGACMSVRLVPPDGPCDGWAVCATYVDGARQSARDDGRTGTSARAAMRRLADR